MIARLRGEPRWSVLTPTEMKSEIGAKMDLQRDGSVFVHQGESAGNDTYTLVFPSRMKGIKGLRLEALADSRLPNGGPGLKAGYGNFVLSELTLQAAAAGSPEQPRRIALRNAGRISARPTWTSAMRLMEMATRGGRSIRNSTRITRRSSNWPTKLVTARDRDLTVRLRHRGPERRLQPGTLPRVIHR